MKILSATGGIAGTNCYLVADEAARQAVLFDAPDHTVAPLLDEAQSNGWDVIGLWLTHGHFDHIADHPIVTQRFPNAKILIHPDDEHKFRDPQRASPFLPISIPPGEPHGHLADGQQLSIGSLACEVIHTPGHAPGHVMFHFPQQQVLIGGDLIIMNAVGRTDFPDADHDSLEASIRRIMRLPDETHLLAGHGEATTLGEQRRCNPYVQHALRKEA